jgi:hypothetical protein
LTKETLRIFVDGEDASSAVSEQEQMSKNNGFMAHQNPKEMTDTRES